MRSYYPGITLYKLAGCLIVLLVHILLFRYMLDMSHPQLNYVVNALKVVIPGFYLISGFLVCKGWTRAADPRRYVTRYLVRFGTVYALFCLLYTAQHVVPDLIRDGLSPGSLLHQFKIVFIVFLLNGPFVQLWFMPPLMFGILASYLLYSRWGTRAALKVTLASFLLVMLLTGPLRVAVDAAAGGSLPWMNNDYGRYLELFAARYLGFGLTFVSMGVWIARNEGAFLRLPARNFAIGAVALTLLETVPFYLFVDWRPSYFMTVSLVPNSALLFYGVLRIRAQRLQAYHPFINLFTMMMFFGHIPLMGINLWVAGGGAAPAGWKDGLAYLAVTLAEITVLTYAVFRIAGRRKRAAGTEAAGGTRPAAELQPSGPGSAQPALGSAASDLLAAPAPAAPIQPEPGSA